MTDACAPESYPAAVAVLRAVYDIVDRLKTWEEVAALDGDALFGEVCARLDAAYAVELCGLARPRAGLAAEAVVAAAPAGQPAAAGDTAVLSRAVTALRQGVQALRDALDRAHAETAAARAETAEARAAAAVQHARALEMETTLGDFARRHDTMFAELMADIGARETDRQAREAERAAMAAEHAAAAEGWRQAMAQLTARADAASPPPSAPRCAAWDAADAGRRMMVLTAAFDADPSSAPSSCSAKADHPRLYRGGTKDSRGSSAFAEDDEGESLSRAAGSNGGRPT
jgi:hypothetical protein